jgi:hypothetical protein
MDSNYIIPLVEDSDGHLVLPFPDDILGEMSWNIGDTLVWKDNGDGTFSISKREDSDSQ